MNLNARVRLEPYVHGVYMSCSRYAFDSASSTRILLNKTRIHSPIQSIYSPLKLSLHAPKSNSTLHGSSKAFTGNLVPQKFWRALVTHHRNCAARPSKPNIAR